MSYILDALKRADAERERGVVPGLHAQQLTPAEVETNTGSRTRLWLVIAVVIFAGAAISGLWSRRFAPITIPQAAVTAAVTAAPPATTAQSIAVSTPAVAIAEPASRPAIATATPAPPAVTLPKPAAISPRPQNEPSLAELADDVRRQIPPMAITGAVYSDNPGQRLLLINGLVLSQGGAAAPEVTLEEIGEHSSVFSSRGTRFRVAH